MSEELLGGNQTTTEGQQLETSQQQTQTTETIPATTQENYFEIKYNKEPVKVSYDEAPTYIQKGLNYDKVHQQVQEYKEDLELFRELTGYESIDSMRQAVRDAQKQQQEQVRQQQFEEAGINPELFNQLLENHPDMQYAREMRAKEQEQQQLRSEIDQLREQFPDLKPDDLTDELFAIKEQRKVPLLHAYLELNFQKLAQQKEQEAIQKLQNNASSTPGSLGAGAEHKTGYSNLSDADKKALRERVLRGENVQL